MRDADRGTHFTALAMECGAKADDPKTKPDERERLLNMRKALLDLAKEQDWLEGRKVPPTQQQQVQTKKKTD